jgi:hypothetical protein
LIWYNALVFVKQGYQHWNLAGHFLSQFNLFQDEISTVGTRREVRIWRRVGCVVSLADKSAKALCFIFT